MAIDGTIKPESVGDSSSSRLLESINAAKLEGANSALVWVEDLEWAMEQTRLLEFLRGHFRKTKEMSERTKAELETALAGLERAQAQLQALTARELERTQGKLDVLQRKVEQLDGPEDDESTLGL